MPIHIFLPIFYYILALFGFQKDLEKSRIIAYISSLPASINIAAHTFPMLEKILKLPPIMPPKAVPLLVMQASVVQNVVSISMFSKENPNAPMTKTRKYRIRNTVIDDTLAALIGLS